MGFSFVNFLIPRFNRSLIRALIGEFFATFLFMFAICGVGLANPDAGPVLSGLCCAFAAIAAIYTFGDLSGAHFNPAVTFAAMMGARIPVIQGIMYWTVQLGATFLVCAILQLLYPRENVFDLLTISKGENVSLGGAVLMEGLLTFFLVLVVYGTVMGAAPKLTRNPETDSDEEHGSDEHRQPLPAGGVVQKSKAAIDKILPIKIGDKETVIVRPTALFAGLAIGCTLGFLCYLGGPVSGGAFNPARATAPAVISGQLKGLWVYWVGDLLGAMLAAIIFNYLVDIKP